MRIVSWDFSIDKDDLVRACYRNKHPFIHYYCIGNILVALYIGKIELKWIESSRLGYYSYRKDGMLIVGRLHQKDNMVSYNGISFYDFFLHIYLFIIALFLRLPNIIDGLLSGFVVTLFLSIVNTLDKEDESLLNEVKNNMISFSENEFIH